MLVPPMGDLEFVKSQRYDRRSKQTQEWGIAVAAHMVCTCLPYVRLSMLEQRVAAWDSAPWTDYLLYHDRLESLNLQDTILIQQAACLSVLRSGSMAWIRALVFGSEVRSSPRPSSRCLPCLEVPVTVVCVVFASLRQFALRRPGDHTDQLLVGVPKRRARCWTGDWSNTGKDEFQPSRPLNMAERIKDSDP